MALVIEDGSGVAGANSYINASDARDYATARGVSLPLSDADIEKLLMKAMDYIESFRAEFQGLKTSPGQALQWPRTGVTVDGYPVASDTIPVVLMSAQAQLAADAYVQELMPTGSGQEVISKKIDVIQYQYAETGDNNPQPVFTKAQALIKPLLKSSGGQLKSIRV